MTNSKDPRSRKFGGNSKKRVSLARNAALVFREGIDPEMIRAGYQRILAGQCPFVEEYEDEDGETQWRLVPDESGFERPTLQQWIAVAEACMNRGWGAPVQVHHLEGFLREQGANVRELDTQGVPASTMHAIRELIRARLPAGAPPDTSGGTPGTPAVIDAEFSEVTDPDRPA